MHHLFFAVVLGSCLAVPGHAAAQSQQPALTLEAATRIADAAQAEATRNKWNVVIAVVDEGGYRHLRRLDGTQLGSVAVAEENAKSAVLFRRPTKAFADAVAPGGPPCSGCPARSRSRVGFHSSPGVG